MTRVSYNVEVDKAQVADAVALFEFVGGNSDVALRVAINKAGPKIKTASSKAIRNRIRLSAKYVGNRLEFKRASRQRLSGRISAESRGILLSRFATNSKINTQKVSWLKPPPIPKQGIKFKVRTEGQTYTKSKSWFLMVLPKSRALGIVRRLSAAERSSAIARGRGPGSQGGKFDVAYGWSVSQAFDTKARDDVLPIAGDELTKQLIDAMRFLLQKKYPKE